MYAEERQGRSNDTKNIYKSTEVTVQEMRRHVKKMAQMEEMDRKLDMDWKETLKCEQQQQEEYDKWHKMRMEYLQNLRQEQREYTMEAQQLSKMQANVQEQLNLLKQLTGAYQKLLKKVKEERNESQSEMFEGNVTALMSMCCLSRRNTCFF